MIMICGFITTRYQPIHHYTIFSLIIKIKKKIYYYIATIFIRSVFLPPSPLCLQRMSTRISWSNVAVRTAWGRSPCRTRARDAPSISLRAGSASGLSAIAAPPTGARCSVLRFPPQCHPLPRLPLPPLLDHGLILWAIGKIGFPSLGTTLVIITSVFQSCLWGNF